MARRRSTRSRKNSRFPLLILALLTLAVGATGGYAWRSYAPLPLPGPWGGDDPYADIKSLPSVTTPRPNPPAGSVGKATSDSAEVARLRAEIDRLKAAQSQTAQEIAEIQIKSVLGEE